MKESRYTKLLTLTSEKEFVDDHYGMPCTKFNNSSASFIPYIIDTPTNIKTILYIEYFDGEAGYIRVSYVKDILDYTTTVTELSGSNMWKTVMYELEGDIYHEGFSLFQCSTEGETPDQTLYLLRVALQYKNIAMSWQRDNMVNVSNTEFRLQISDRSNPKNVLKLASTTLTSTMREGMLSRGVSNATTDPLYFRVRETGDSLYWRSVATKKMSFLVEYYDEGTDDIVLSYYDDVDEQSVSVTKTNTLTWKKVYIVNPTEQGRVNGDLYITSLESDDPGDPIVDRGDHEFTITTPVGTPAHSNAEYHVGDSTIDMPSGTHVLSIAPNDVFDISTGPFTLMCWVKFRNTPSHYDWICNGDSSLDGWKLKGKYSDPWFAGFDGGSHEMILDTDMHFDIWHHLAITSDGTSTYGFYQGVHEWTKSGYTTVNYDPTYGVTIGASAGSYSSPIDGYIDEIYLKKGEAKYLPADSPFTPIERLADDENYKAIGGVPMLFQDGYDVADLKLSTTGNSSLYVSSIEMVSMDNDAHIIWMP